MNERQEKTSDILGKLTVLGTIVLPMNVVTGIWGMNWYVLTILAMHQQPLTFSKYCPWTGH
jgi:Mg2+ and Co2+ transporter CorA